MKKKLMGLLVTLMMVMVIFAGCTTPSMQSTNSTDEMAPTENTGNELTHLKVAVMPMQISAPVYYAKEMKLDKEYGLDIELVLFSSGATMNEALASNEYDVAPIGGAGIFGVANYDGIYIADYQYLTGGDAIFAQKGSEALNATGSNPTYPDIKGSAETVKGSTILYTPGTTSQMLVSKWLTALGIGSDEVNLLGMEYAQTLQAFEAGEADFACMCSPYIFSADDAGYERVADIETLDMINVHSIMATRSAYENKKEALADFVNMIYDANEQMMSDWDTYTEWVKKWYETNGAEITDEDVDRECEIKKYVGWDDIDEVEYGAYHKEYAEFFVSLEQLTADQVKTVEDNTVTDILELAKTRRK